MDDLRKLADECEDLMWQPDDRLPQTEDFYNGQIAPSVRAQLSQVLKVLAALCRQQSKSEDEIRAEERERCELILLQKRDEWKAHTHQGAGERMAAEVLDKAAAAIRSLPQPQAEGK